MLTTPATPRVRDPFRKERILTAASELIAGRGYHPVSMADIGAAAGITGAAVYRHFASKSALLVALFDRAVDALFHDAVEIVVKTTDREHALDLLIAQQVDFAVAERAVAQVYHRESHLLPEGDRRRLRRKQRLYVEEWVGVVLALRPELTEQEARALVHAALGAVQSVLFHNIDLPQQRLRPLLVDAARGVLRAAAPVTACHPEGP